MDGITNHSAAAPIILRAQDITLQRLLASAVLFGNGPIRLVPDRIAETRRDRTEMRLRFWQAICGCQLAALAFLAVLATEAWALWATDSWAPLALAQALGWAFLAAIATKLITVAFAKSILLAELLLWRRRTLRMADPAGEMS